MKKRTTNSIDQNRSARRIKFKNNRSQESSLNKTKISEQKLSENTTLKKRSVRYRDDKIFRYIINKLRYNQPVKLTNDKTCTVYLFGRTIGQAKRDGRRVIPKLFIPHWDHASPNLKMLGWSLASYDLSATPFTLNIDPKLIAKGKASSHGLARYLQDRIARQLRRRIPNHKIDFWFVIEQGIGDEPHLHGAITIPVGERDHVSLALREAGGDGRCKSRQLKFSQPRCPTTWIGYSTKWKLVSEGHLEASTITAATKGLRSRAKKLYNNYRCREITLHPL